MSEVIEHLLRPELAVWEIARVLRPGGVFIMTTNNASEVPLRSPLSHLFAWLEKAFGAHRPELISLRPWVWPWPVDKDILPPGSPQVYLPHTHHIYGETRELFARRRSRHVPLLDVRVPAAAEPSWPRCSTAEGETGRKAVDALEAVAQAHAARPPARLSHVRAVAQDPRAGRRRPRRPACGRDRSRTARLRRGRSATPGASSERTRPSVDLARLIACRRRSIDAVLQSTARHVGRGA